MRFQIKLGWPVRGRGRLELYFDGPLSPEAFRQIRETVTGLYENSPIGGERDSGSTQSGRWNADLLPFYCTDEGFADLRAKLSKALCALGYEAL